MALLICHTNINACCCSQFLACYFVTSLWTKLRFKSARTRTDSENIQLVWLTTAVDRRTSRSVQLQTPRIILGGRSTLMFRHWSIRLPSPTGETLQVTVRHWLTLAVLFTYHWFIFLLFFYFLLLLFSWWGVSMVICLDRGEDCLHMIQLMPLHS